MNFNFSWTVKSDTFCCCFFIIYFLFLRSSRFWLQHINILVFSPLCCSVLCCCSACCLSHYMLHSVSCLCSLFGRFLHRLEKQHQRKWTAVITITKHIYSRSNYPAVYRILGPASSCVVDLLVPEVFSICRSESPDSMYSRLRVALHLCPSLFYDNCSCLESLDCDVPKSPGWCTEDLGSLVYEISLA